MSDMNPRIELPPSLTFIERDWLSSNHLLGRSERGNVLVDSGYASRREMTLQLVDRLLGTAPLHRVINTHTHSDHVGGNAALKARHGCRITIPLQAREAVEQWQEDKLHYAPLGQVCDRFAADDYFDRGDTIEIGGLPWQALGSPGHDMDSLLLYQPQHRILVSADALWENGFGILFPEFFDEPGFEAQEATLRLLEDLEVDIVLPGHGPMFSDFRPALQRAQKRLAYFRANPERHALLALKVGLSFLLLDRGALSLANLETTFGRLSLIERICRRHFGGDTSGLTLAVVKALVEAKVARISDGELLPADPADVQTRSNVPASPPLV
jgi:glyoxylase-like metal-dependent hydrolase (beta-lactamase superfamily II)